MIYYDLSLLEEVAARLDLREPNKAAVGAVARVLSDADEATEVVCDLATAVGKTYIAAALIDYLAAGGVRNVLIVTPGTTIQNKTVGNFTPGHPKFVGGLAAVPMVVTVEDYRRGAVGSALHDPEVLKLFVFNVQQIIRPTANMSRRVRSYDETLGDDLYSHLRESEDLVVIADEHHVYNPYARAFSSAVRDLDPMALVGLTATPHPKTPDEAIVFRYTLAEAIADGYVKIPVLVGRTDGHTGPRTQLADGCQMLRLKRAALAAWADEAGVEPVNPVMLVVCPDIAEAEQMAELLAADDMIGTSDGVLTITSQSSDEALKLLETVEEPDSPVRAIVSVQMLKEGWDVKNIYVICALRALESEALTEQILGRGLRLPFGQRTGVPMLDTVEVISHRRFRELLDRADVLLEAVVPEQSSPVATSVDTAAAESLGRAELRVASDSVDDGGEVPERQELVMTIESMEQRKTQMERSVLGLQQPMTPRPEAPRIRFPLLKTVVTPMVFSLSDIANDKARALGQKFLTEFNVSLNRVAIEASRTDDGGVELDRVSQETVDATQLRLPVEDLADQLTAGVFALDLVTQEKKEMTAAKRLVSTFLAAAGVLDDTEAATWTEARAKAAVDAFRRMIRSEYLARPNQLGQEITKVEYPPERLPSPTSTSSRHDSGAFVRGRHYVGWSRSILPAVSFDAKSTEFALADLIDGAAQDIAWWVRLGSNDDVYIEWGGGRKYHPDFIAIDTAGAHWLLEAKSDKDIGHRDVLDKKAAAERWVRHVNDSGESDAEWRYLVVTETHLRLATSWGSLLSLAT